MIALVNTTWENKISVLLQPVLKASPTHHSWMVTSHVSLGNMEKQWKLFTRQMIRTYQLLPSLLQKPSAPTQLFSKLEAEINNLNCILTSYQPLIQAATQLFKKEPSFHGVPVSSKHMRSSLLPFLGDALSWLTGTATTKDINAIKTRIKQLIATQQNQQETLVHIISILNVARYATQVKWQHISILMDAMEKTHQDVMTLYNITQSLYSSLSYWQIILHTNPSWQISGIVYITWEKLPYTPWIILMQQLQVYFQHMCYLLKISGKCYHTLRKNFLLPCTYQVHLKMYSISTDIYIPMSWFQTNNSYYWLMYQYRILHNKWKYMKYLIWIYLTEITQHAMIYKTSTQA